MLNRIAIVVSHPTQYYGPWFSHIAQQQEVDLRVFYLWEHGETELEDKKFGKRIQWDVPILDGYHFQFVPNTSTDPGTHHFAGLKNPNLLRSIQQFNPTTTIAFGFGWSSLLKLALHHPGTGAYFVRGDNHSLDDMGKTSLRTIGRSLARRLLFRRCDGFLAVGTANADYYRSYGVNRRQIHFVPHCIDNDRFAQASSSEGTASFRERNNVKESDTLVVFAGKFERKKRPLALVNAFSRLHSNKTKLWMVGGGELESEIRTIAAQDDRITVIPFQNQSQIPTIYSAADLFVLPSGWNETWGLAINESMACGTPALVSDRVGCHADLVNDNTGWKFDSASELALLETLEKATSDRKELERRGTECQKHIQAYSYSAATSALLDAIS